MVVYLGQFISEKIRDERGLPTLNAAGTNRMHRVAQAIRDAEADCVIVSPGASCRMAWKGVWFHKASVTRSEGVPVCLASALGVPFVSAGWALISTLALVVSLHRRHGVSGVVVYNYRMIECLVATVARWMLRVPVLLDLEDVSIPKLTDLKSGGIESFIRQIWCGFMMGMTLRVCHAVFAPTSRFRSVLPHGKKFEVLDGCMRIPALLSGEPETACASICAERPLALLFSGKIEFEHGVDVLAKAILSIDMMQNAHNYHFHICGGGSALEWLRRELFKVQQVNVFIHGFVSNCLFRQIFDRAEVCLVLQKPDGRHSFFKTPSKGYEALCAGKTLVVSNIGDFGMLPASVCRVVDPLNEESLVEAIKTLTREDVRRYGKHALAHARTRWDSAVVGRRIVGMMASAVDE